MQKKQQSGPEALHEDITITIDEFKGFYRKNDLGVFDVTFLIDRGYIVSSHVPLGGHRAEDYLLKPMERKLIATGIKLEIPYGYEAQVRPKSGLALDLGISHANAVGTIDSS